MNVLIVDDEPLARERLSRMVGDLDGYRVLEPAASNGEEALSLIDSLKPDVVLLDIRMPGLDGQKMSKSYNNTIRMREDKASVEKKVRTMPTDPARVRRTDPGDPDKCPVWQLHQVYSDADTKEWVQKGCRSAGIGCLECKQPVIDGILREQQPMLERAQKYMDDPSLLRAIIADGCDNARKVTQETMREVREAMGLTYS